MPRIVFTLEDNSEIEAELDVDIITIGRNSENGFVIPSASVSSYHARITRQGEDFFVQDLGSTNGTKLNGVEIEEAKLDDGDYLAFGDIRGVVHLHDAIQPLAADVYVAAPVIAASTASTPMLSSVAKLDALTRPQKPMAPRVQSRPLVKQNYKESSSGCGGFFFTLLLLAGAFIVGLHIRHAADNPGKVLIIDIGKKFREGAYGQINGITKPKTSSEAAPKEETKPAEPEKPAAEEKAAAKPAPAPTPAPETSAPAMSDSPSETPAAPAPAPAPAAPAPAMDGSSMMGQ